VRFQLDVSCAVIRRSVNERAPAVVSGARLTSELLTGEAHVRIGRCRGR